jgi:hypothetical protein
MPRFTLRTLFWLILVVAICLAWWIDRQGLARRLDVSEIQRQEISEAAREDVKNLRLKLRQSAGGPGAVQRPTPSVP